MGWVVEGRGKGVCVEREREREREKITWCLRPVNQRERERDQIKMLNLYRPLARYKVVQIFAFYSTHIHA